MPTTKPKAKRLPAQQTRSRQTEERLLNAMQSLLERRSVDEITVEAIVNQAHTSVGAFYKRFPSKEALLPILLQRLQVTSREQLETQLAAPQWRECGLAARVKVLIESVAHAHLKSREVIRACVASRFYSEQMMTPENVAASQAVMERMRTWLLECRNEIEHPQPELAVRLGLYMCLQSLQTALLFEALPASIKPEDVIAEAIRMLQRYLGVGAKSL